MAESGRGDERRGLSGMGEIVKMSRQDRRTLAWTQKQRARGLERESFTGANPDLPYTLPVPVGVAGRFQKVNSNAGEKTLNLVGIGEIVSMGSFFGGLATMPSSIMSHALADTTGGLLLIGAIVVATGTPALAGALFGHAHWERPQRARLTLLHRHLGEHFSRWVNARYGVTVADEPEAVGAAVVTVSLNPERGMSFTDTAGREFQVVAGDSGFTVTTVTAPVETRTAVSATTAATALLWGEARVLHAHIMEQVNLVQGRPMSTETAHVVGRVISDVVETLAAWRQVVDLGEVEVLDEAALTQTLTALNAEMIQVVKNLRSEAKRELIVQQRYVTNRAERDALQVEILNLEQGNPVQSPAQNPVMLQRASDHE